MKAKLRISPETEPGSTTEAKQPDVPTMLEAARVALFGRKPVKPLKVFNPDSDAGDDDISA